MRHLLKLLAITSLSLSAATAQSLGDAQQLFDQGKWKEAAAQATALNTSDGYTLAAKATTLGAALSAEGDRKGLFTKAEGYARKAIALDNKNPEAYFELARVQGRLAQFVGILKSLDLAGEIKTNLQKALELDNKYASAYVALGLWNANLDAKGLIARSATGARRDQVVPNFERAIALEPEGIVHRLEYANALLLQGNRAGARNQLDKALKLEAKTYWDRRDQAIAKAILDQLK